MCARLEAELSSLQNQPAARDDRLEASYSQARRQLDSVTARYRGMNCGRSSLFGPRPPPECRALENQMEDLEDQVERLANAVRRSRSSAGNDSRRQSLMAALAQNGCGGYQQAAPQQRRQGGLFGLLFGNRGAPVQEAPVQEMPMEQPRSSTYRTVCVRTCDGFFFPVSFATNESRFPEDENICRRTCPGTEAQLFTYPNPGGTLEQAVSTTGQPYKDMPNAFKYQTQFVKDCSCKPANQSWAQALAGAEDASVQSGDIIVDENRSRQMSQPAGGRRTATPAEAARAAQDSAHSVTTEGVQEDVGGTDVSEPEVRTAVPVYGPNGGAPQIYAPPR
ncbi:DUF2865 domain-containing protein [Terrihabitans sp. B22-R8]|uniref:DUF2865 domain-containing protein n=1 Tax=Terrihabitans sp. B22-R8 TaxID=3425128 RepID=UPI00403CC9D8